MSNGLFTSVSLQTTPRYAHVQPTVTSDLEAHVSTSIFVWSCEERNHLQLKDRPGIRKGFQYASSSISLRHHCAVPFLESTMRCNSQHSFLLNSWLYSLPHSTVWVYWCERS